MKLTLRMRRRKREQNSKTLHPSKKEVKKKGKSSILLRRTLFKTQLQLTKIIFNSKDEKVEKNKLRKSVSVSKLLHKKMGKSKSYA